MVPTDPRYVDHMVTTTILHARTRDELVHTGALIRPATEVKSRAVLWIHGGGQNFYYPTYLRIGTALSRYGYAFLSANTRGHDYNGKWDLFEHAPLDLVAWIDRLTALGYPQVVLADDATAILGVLVARRDAAIAEATRRRNQAHQLLLQCDPTYRAHLPALTTPDGITALESYDAPRASALDQTRAAAVQMLGQRLRLESGDQ